MKNIKDGLVKLIKYVFPNNNSCIFCGNEIFARENAICDSCEKDLPYVDKICKICGQEIKDMGSLCLNCKKSPKKYYDRAFAPFRYEGKVVVSIHNLKYHNQKWLGDYLSKIMFDYISQFDDVKFDLVIPIPLNEKRYKQRGYNQSRLLCNEFSRRGYIVDETSVIRTKNTQSQTNFTSTERQENMKNAFQVVSKENLKGKNILVVDDVYTTGATMNEMCETLHKAKVGHIYCLTLAHVVKPILTETNK